MRPDVPEIYRVPAASSSISEEFYILSLGTPLVQITREC